MLIESARAVSVALAALGPRVGVGSRLGSGAAERSLRNVTELAAGVVSTLVMTLGML